MKFERQQILARPAIIRAKIRDLEKELIEAEAAAQRYKLT